MSKETTGMFQAAKSSKPGEDRRQDARFRVSMPVYIRLSDGDVARAHAVDLSKGGLYLEYGSPAEVGRVFEMMFDLPFAKEFKRVYVKACVTRSVIVGGKDVFGIAFSFNEFARDTDKVLTSYLELRGLKKM